jgi:hypothetical protein
MILLKEQELFAKSELPLTVLYADRGVGKTVACLSRLYTLLFEPNRIIGFVCVNKSVQQETFEAVKEALKGRKVSIDYRNRIITSLDLKSSVYFLDSEKLNKHTSLRVTDCIVDDLDKISNEALTCTFIMTRSYSHKTTLAYTSCLYSDKMKSLQDCYSFDVNTLTLYIRHPHFNPFQKV